MNAICVRGDAQDIAGVLDRMEAIDRATPEADGVSYFNRLYQKVTEAVLVQVEGLGYEDDAFISRLDVVFANLYFEAFAADLRGDECSRAWRPLFEGRRRKAAPVQFALAGMNAHINFDLPVAVVQTCGELLRSPHKETPHYRDYERTNAVLGAVQDQIKEWFAVGLIAAVDARCGKLDDALAMWSVVKARRVAWEQAEVMWEIREDARRLDRYRATLEQMVGFAGAGLLL